MDLQWMIGGLTLGMVSSLHCVGMCGPLALSLPVQHLPRPVRIVSVAAYNIGRLFTYAGLGMIGGAAGRGVHLAGFQQGFSLVMGILVLSLLVLYYGYHYAWQPAFMNRLYSWLQAKMSRLMRSDKTVPGFMLMGMANGLLPCGMVYVALATALTATSLDQSIGFMLMFGTGTLPAMLALSYFGHMLSLSWRFRLRKAIPLFMAIVGLALLLRGLNLGIPYISPRLHELGKAIESCHV